MFTDFPLPPRVGLEPTTPRLTAACSTIELSRITINLLRKLTAGEPLRDSPRCFCRVFHGAHTLKTKY